MNRAVRYRQLRLLALALTFLAGGIAAQTCTSGYAVTVLASSVGSSQLAAGNNPDLALGDTPSDYFSTGNGGQITVAFAQAFSNDGTSGPDIEVDEKSGNGSNDCYWICLVPHNSSTAAAMAAAGWTAFSGGTLYQIPFVFCEDQVIDLDNFLPGYPAGSLVFNALMIEDDGNGGNGAEIARVKAYRVCNPVTTPPCQPVFASTVVNSYAGGSNSGTPATNALGDTVGTFFSMGNGGSITVGFPVNFTTSGDSTPDIFVDENGNADCYWVCLKAADAYTQAVLMATGFTNNGTMFQLPFVWCGDALIDIDMFLPGHPTGQLVFSQVMIEDDGNGGNGGEVERIRVDFTCFQSPSCAPGYATTVVSAVPGANQQVANSNPAFALGNTPNDNYSLGQNGSLAVCFANLFTTNGGGGTDLSIDEYNQSDCYYVSLLPADATSAGLMAAAGLIATPGGYYALPSLFCSDVAIDIDVFIPAANPHQLLISCVKINDDGSAGDGAEIVKLVANEVCDLARLGDKVFADVDCDGVRDGNEAGVPGVVVHAILNSTGNIVATKITDINGCYDFILPAGSYRVEIAFDTTKYSLTMPNAGSDDNADSDVLFDNKTGVLTLLPNQIRTDVDAGLCIICTGIQAYINSLPAGCGGAFEPVMTATVPTVGTFWTLSVDGPFPNALLFLFASLGPPNYVIFPGSTCQVWLNLSTVIDLGIFPTDANGDWSVTIPIMPDPAIVGFEIVFQSRVCFPAIPGPIPGVPDFPSNALHLIIGCP